MYVGLAVLGRLKYIYTLDILMLEHSYFAFGIANEKYTMYKLPGIDQILAEFIQVEDRTCILSSIKLLILIGVNKNSHKSERNLLSCTEVHVSLK
jgi:hypothetical protein